MCFYKEAHKIFKYRPGVVIFIDTASAAMAVLECDQRLCIQNMFPGGADAAGPRMHLENYWS